MNRYRPTFWEFVLYWQPSEDDPLTIFLAGAWIAMLATTALFT